MGEYEIEEEESQLRSSSFNKGKGALFLDISDLSSLVSHLQVYGFFHQNQLWLICI